MRTEKNKELSILVYSCWKNSDMWNIFLTLFNKYWSDCEFKMILLTDYLGDHTYYEKFDEIVVLDSNWHDMIVAGIKKAKTDYVMLFMDDYLICDYIKNDDIMKYLKFARKYDVANIRLMESPTKLYHIQLIQTFPIMNLELLIHFLLRWEYGIQNSLLRI